MFDDDSYNTIAVSESFSINEEEVSAVNDEKRYYFYQQFCFYTAISEGKPVDSRLRFSNNGDKIYIHLTIEDYQQEHTITWEWIKPDGELFNTVKLDLKPANDLGYKIIRDDNIWDWLSTSALDHSVNGIWNLNIYVDNEIVLTRQFVFD